MRSSILRDGKTDGGGAASTVTKPVPDVPRRALFPAGVFSDTIAKTEAYLVSRRERKKVEMLFAHLKRILRLDRLRLRGPNGARDEFLLAATAQNLRKLAKLVPVPGVGSRSEISCTWVRCAASA